jgi:UDP-N-acetylglucosamine acyltransferase
MRRITKTKHTTIGSRHVFEEGCVVGAIPQDLKYAGGPALLMIGHRNRFGRGVTAHIGTENGGYLTRIGNDNVLSEWCHVAHDCYVDDGARLGRHVMLAGHIHIQTGAVLEELIGVHHFVTIGRYSRVGPGTPVRRDVPPYTEFASLAPGAQASVRGIHEDGIRRAGLNAAEKRDLRWALQELFYDESALQTRIEQLFSLGVEGEVAELCLFCQRSLRGVYGRHRELFRGRIPPEAKKHLSPEQLAKLQRVMT